MPSWHDRLDEQRDDAFREFHRLTPEERGQRVPGPGPRQRGRRDRDPRTRRSSTGCGRSRCSPGAAGLPRAGRCRHGPEADGRAEGADPLHRGRDVLRPRAKPVHSRAARRAGLVEQARTGRDGRRSYAVLTEEQSKQWKEMTGEAIRRADAPFSPARLARSVPRAEPTVTVRDHTNGH